jgi:hypothetical protein
VRIKAGIESTSKPISLWISPFKFGVRLDVLLSSCLLLLTAPSRFLPRWVAVSDFSYGKNLVEYCHGRAAAVLNKLVVFGMFPINRDPVTIDS